MELNLSQVEEAVAYIDKLDDRLLVLRFNLGKLEAALERAFLPITARAVPILNSAVQGLTDFVNGAGQVIAALFGGVRVEASKTVRTTTRALKRALADFDQLDKLSFGGSGTSTVTVPAKVKEVEKQYKAIAQRIEELLKPLKEIDLTPACEAFARLKDAIAPISRTLFSGLEWAWFNILTPMAKWGAEQALPVFLDLLSAGLNVLSAAIEAAKPVLSWLWENLLKPMGQWAGQTLLASLQALTDRLNALAGKLTSGKPLVEAFTMGLGNLGTGVGALSGLFGGLNGQWSAMGTGMDLLTRLAGGLKEAFFGADSTAGGLGKTLTGLFDGLSPGFRTVANAAIAILNTALLAVEKVLNSMVSTLNAFRIDIPAWVPFLGGKSFGLNLGTVDLPEIPYLAQGAVLPANKPFLAMVGDQRHGTNIEAPLATIQEAVAQVLGDTAAVQADTNRLLARILSAIDGIEVGDETIGRAARRYESRMALMGGAL